MQDNFAKTHPRMAWYGITEEEIPMLREFFSGNLSEEKPSNQSDDREQISVDTFPPNQEVAQRD